MLVLSHRGLRNRPDVHENTLEAFEAAVDAGVDGIETDVRRSADGALVLFHDRSVADGRPVHALTRMELQAAVGHPVPTLQEALSFWPDVLWNVEIKTLDAARSTFDLLTTAIEPGRLLVTSFLHDVVAECARTLESPCGILVCHRPVSVGALIEPWEDWETMRTIVWHVEVLDSAVLEEVRSCGYRSFCYGVEGRDEHAYVISLKMDGLITNEPALARTFTSETA